MATLLTGAGYIGATLLDRLARQAAPETPPVVVLDNFYSTPRENLVGVLPSGTRLVEGDVAEPGDVARAFDALDGSPTTVFHLAAQPSAAMAVREPALTERSNLVGARLVLEAARERQASVVFGGSFRVYGDDLVGQCVDEQTAYGRVGDLSHLSKVYVEQLARMLDLRFASVRLGVTYGLSPIMKTAPAFMTVPNLFCRRAARGEVLHVLEDRPMAFIHVADAADALLAAAHATRSGDVWQAFNAAPEVASIGSIASLVQRLMHQRGGQTHIEGTAGGGGTFTVRSRLGLRPAHSLETGLVDVLQHFIASR